MSQHSPAATKHLKKYEDGLRESLNKIEEIKLDHDYMRAAFLAKPPADATPEEQKRYHDYTKETLQALDYAAKCFRSLRQDADDLVMSIKEARK